MVLKWLTLPGQSLRRPCRGGGGSHVGHLNFKTSRVGVYKCLSLIVGFAVTVTIWQREVVSCHDFILRAVATFLAMSLVGIYPGRASLRTGHQRGKWNIKNVRFHIPCNLKSQCQPCVIIHKRAEFYAGKVDILQTCLPVLYNFFIFT